MLHFHTIGKLPRTAAGTALLHHIPQWLYSNTGSFIVFPSRTLRAHCRPPVWGQPRFNKCHWIKLFYRWPTEWHKCKWRDVMHSELAPKVGTNDVHFTETPLAFCCAYRECANTVFEQFHTRSWHVTSGLLKFSILMFECIKVKAKSITQWPNFSFPKLWGHLMWKRSRINYFNSITQLLLFIWKQSINRYFVLRRV